MLLTVLVLQILSVQSLVNDPFFNHQWYLKSKLPTLNVEKAWKLGHTGKNIVIGIADQPLNQNVRDVAVIPSSGSQAAAPLETHGDSSAGVAAAIRNNSFCGSGVAPDSKIRAYTVVRGTSWTNKSTVASWIKTDSVATPSTDIISSSFGQFDLGSLALPVDPAIKDAQDFAAKNGRGGLGTLFLQAAGNGGNSEDSCAYEGTLQEITTITIAGVSRANQMLKDGESCSAIHAAAYSQNYDSTGDIVTVAGSQCTMSFGQSSAACPMAAGVVALVLSANPGLGWRDVHHLIAHTANPAVFDQSSFTKNSAGIKYSNSFGFGVLDACRMCREAVSWRNVPAATTCTYTANLSTARDLYGSYVLTGSCSVRYIEHVVTLVDLCAAAPRARVQIALVSPHNTRSIIVPGRGSGDQSSNLTANVKSLAFWGESLGASDSWRVEITERDVPQLTSPSCTIRQLLNLTLTVYGTSTAAVTGTRSYSNEPNDPCYTGTETTAVDTGLTRAAVIGIVVGCVVAVLTALTASYFIYKHKSNKDCHMGKPRVEDQKI